MKPITRLEKFLNGIVYGGSTPEPPITRIETMLNDIKNGDVVSITPITREETFLAKISGANVDIPTPITRIEMFLEKICGVEIATPSPIVRIEHWLNEWASGDDPLGTFTGAIARFFSRASKPIVKIEANFTPIQSGTGDPSPTNIRPISGHTGCEVFVKPEYDPQATPTASISFGQTVYGGTMTINEDGSCDVVVTYAIEDLGNMTWKKSANSRFMYSDGISSVDAHPSNNDQIANIVCSHLKAESANSVDSTVEEAVIGVAQNGNIRAKYPGFPTASGAFKTDVTGWKLVYELATPVTIPFTASQINTLVGENVVWVNDSDNISVTAYGSPID